MILIAQDGSDVRTKVIDLEEQAQRYLQQQKPQLASPVLQDIVTLDPRT